MLSLFKDYVLKEQLFKPTDKVLLAVSGGVDSMVMAHLFQQANAKIGIAHCNFQLRGTDSDADQQLVKEVAESWEVPFFTIKFDTIEESEQQKKSVELMSRELRYAWFEELMERHDYQYIATAHHLNDSLETLLYNLTKGTGIRGLHGIPVKNGSIIRPISFASRADIITYAADYNILFREDASNQSLDYNRNLIRHKVIPPLKEINPSLEKTFSKTLKYLKETEALFLSAITTFKNNNLTEEDGLVKVNIDALKKEPAKSTILYEIIAPMGFNGDHVDQIFRAIDNVGAQFYSKTHHILVERTAIIIKEKIRKVTVWLKVEMLPEKVSLPKKIFNATILKKRPAKLNQGNHIAMVDLDKVTLPLVIRNWKEGDRFLPLGMNGNSKKVKDYLRDKKVSRIEKSEVLVLESAGKIVWLIGFRADDRFKITEDTTKILKLSVEKS